MIPFRIRNVLRKITLTALVLAVIVVLVLLCWLLWLNRYVIYTREGAVFNFQLSADFGQGEVAKPPASGQIVDIYYNEGENVILPTNKELTQLSGICITGPMLSQSMEQVQTLVNGLTAGTPVLLDVKNFRGEFYYSTTLGKNAQSVDVSQMDGLIAKLRQKDVYLIARLPALRDYWYGLENVNDGIFNPNQMSLWMDEERCYWLNPSAQGTVTHLIQIVTELRGLGFDEVVFTDFRVPDTQKIYFKGDRTQAINEAAKTLVKACATEDFALSFVGGYPGFALPEGRSRLYMENVAAAEAATLAQGLALEQPEIRLVFLTDLKDTRFDAFGVMRPADIPVE